jgi:arabinan endo-1,5-alpha-L-arabinosidase
MALLFLSVFFAGFGTPSNEAHPKKFMSPDTNGTYTNPVFEPILADPSVVKGDDGWFYAYGTQDDWGDGQGSRLVPVLKSHNLVDWSYQGTAFERKPSWKAKGGIWAPDVVKVGPRYHMYYSFSTWGDPDPGIGLAIAEHPQGPFSDLGKLFLSSEVDVPNSIDPYFYEEQGQKHLFWGSYSQAAEQGIYAVALSADGLTVPDLSRKHKVAAGDFEAVVIHRRGGYYYLIGSKENCCNGADSKYHLRMGRSTSLLGPYLDKDGRPLTERGAGTVLLHGNNKYAGTGHNARLIKDTDGIDWILYHAIDKAQPKVPSGANRRVLMLDRLDWRDGWPTLNRESPSLSPQKKPSLGK